MKNLGKMGDKVKVSDGYARNYLIPRDLAVEATAGQVRALKNTKDAEKQKQHKLLAEAKETAARLNAAAVTIRTRVGEGGKLYGSVTSKDIVAAIAQACGISIDKRKLEINEPIKSIGTYTATVKIHPNVTANVKVEVIET